MTPKRTSLHVPPLFNHLVGEVISIERPRGLPVRRQLRQSPNPAQVSRRCKAGNWEPKGYALAKTIVHGLLVLITWPVGVSMPFAWLILNGTIVSVFC